MGKKEKSKFNNIFANGFSLGLIIMGAYNVYWFVRYFMNGRDISIIPPKEDLFLTDICILLVVTGLVIIYAVSRIQRQNDEQHPNDSGSEDK